MDDLFPTCLSFTLAQEGGFVDDPRDPGGATFRGITLASLREYLRASNTPPAVLKGLDAKTIAAIYRARFWAPMRCGMLPAGIDLMIFDHGVNAGASRPVPMMQDVLGVAGDGHIGPVTLEAIGLWPALNLIGTLRDRQEQYYRALKMFGTFGHGWLNRLSRRYTLAARLASAPPPAAAKMAA